MKCELCSDVFTLERYTCAHGDLPKDWHLYIVHNHELETPQWLGVLFHHQAREKWAPTAKEILEIRKRQMQKLAVDRKIESDSVD